MLFKKNPPLDLLGCNTCYGIGHVGVRKCSECRGMSTGQFVRDAFLYWGEPLTAYHIRLRKAKRTLQKFEMMGALVFGIGFLLLFVWFGYERDVLDDFFTYAFWAKVGNFADTLFWLAIMSFSYLVYRVIDGKRDPELVQQKAYGEAQEPEPQELPMLETWENVKQLGRRKHTDISLAYTDQAKHVLEEMYHTAERYGEQEVRIPHLFFALLSAQNIRGVFIRLGIPPETLQAHIAKGFQKKKTMSSPRISEDVKQIFFHAYEHAYDARQEYVHVTELLLATVRQSEAVQELLYDLEVDKQKLANVIEWIRIRERLKRQHQKFAKAAARRSKHGMDRAMTAIATPYLNNFSKDLTIAAKFGHLSPCVARDREIDEIFRIIDGGRQSVLLVGQHGVGKMSIVEGITQRMIEDDTPDRLKDKRLVQISTSALMAGTTVAGAQERLINMMNEVGRAGNIILFINNVHDLMSGSGDGGEGLDVSETISEYLGPGRFLTFATTTTEGFNRHIVNSQLGTVFAPVQVGVMDENQAIQVLESKAGPVEYKHQVFFSYDAIEQSVALASKYLHDQVLPESAISIMTEGASLAKSQRGANTLVSGEDIAAVVSSKTGIPTTSISEDESTKLLRLEEEMHKRVIGQDEAVGLVANALRRARAEIRSQNRPIANFLFLGPTGVGKTELAKTIARVYFGGEERMIRVDMSEYQDKSGIYRLIGQPGQQGTGLLTEAVRQSPFSLVLLDEMEKADPDILNLFLQVFDDGRLTDSVGRVIDFTNTIIIATSNAGTNYVQEQISAGVALAQIRETLIRGELKKYYRPEFLNRFDSVVLFKSLEREEIKQIAGLMLKRVESDLETKGIGFRVEDVALEALATAGFDPEFGARPMRRAIQDHVENKLAELVLGGKLKRRDVVVVGEGLSIRVERM